MKKILSLILCIVCVSLLFSACGKNKGNGGSDGEATKLTIYKARSSGMVDGKDEEKVRKAIEDKFYKDTGEKISLDVKLYTDDELTTKVDTNWAKRSSDIDAVIHYTSEDSGSAIKKYAASPETVYEVSSLLNQYGENIWKYIRQDDEGHVVERSAYMPYTDGTYSMNLIPGVELGQGYAMVVRKDMMRELYNAGHISFSPEEFDVSNDNYRSMTFSEFNTFLYACKNHIENIRYPLSGYPWDLNRVLGGVFSADLYSIQKDDNGNYAPAQFASETADLLNQMWTWAKEGVWESESASMTDSIRNANFFAGYSAVYCSYPQIDNLISIMRMFSNANTSGELMVIAPLETDEGDVNGYMAIPRAFSGLILPDRENSDAEMVVKYINWMYSDVENYELAKYGIKGEHWNDGDDYVFNGKTYKTWVYPDGKEDEFNANPPYSGKYCILPNINVCNKVRGDYNTQEKGWYVLATQEFPAFSCDTEPGVWMPEIPREYKTMYNSIDGNYVEHVRSVAWAGLGNDSVYTLLEKYISDSRRDNGPYLTYIDQSIKNSLAYFDNLFKD